jgi:hypothetical protein
MSHPTREKREGRTEEHGPSPRRWTCFDADQTRLHVRRIGKQLLATAALLDADVAFLAKTN